MAFVFWCKVGRFGGNLILSQMQPTRQIYLSIDINANDKCFRNLINCDKLNIGEIIRQQGSRVNPSELEKSRGKMVANRILNHPNDVFIGFAIRSQEDLETVMKSLKAKKLKITTIYVDNGKRREALIEKYRKDYALHSRWLDYSPAYMEQSYLDFDQQIENIRQYAIKNKIEVVAI